MHRAGFEPAPPKREQLKCSALDHSAIDAYKILFGAVSIHTPGTIDKSSIGVEFAVSIFKNGID